MGLYSQEVKKKVTCVPHKLRNATKLCEKNDLILWWWVAEIPNPDNARYCWTLLSWGRGPLRQLAPRPHFLHEQYMMATSPNCCGLQCSHRQQCCCRAACSFNSCIFTIKSHYSTHLCSCASHWIVNNTTMQIFHNKKPHINKWRDSVKRNIVRGLCFEI